MTAAVAGAAARGAAARGAAAGAGRAGAAARSTSTTRAGASRSSTSSARARALPGREVATGRTTGRKRTPAKAAAKRPPSSKGYMDAIAAGPEKKPAPAARPEAPAARRDSGGGRSGPAINLSMPAPVSSGAGVVLALLFWTWIAIPFLKGGPGGVRDQLRAKFVNKGPNGEYLK